MKSKHTLHGRTVALDVVTDGEGPKWNMLAYTGEFMGYRGGEQPFAFTVDHFNAMVANFRAHPAYCSDALGVGCGQVVPFDFDHASELYPADGSMPVTGCPAQGWVLELECRPSANGGFELWGLCDFHEPAKTYVREGRYRWVSIACAFESVDPVSGQQQGCLLTSVALTNRPFLQGLPQIAAAHAPLETTIMSTNEKPKSTSAPDGAASILVASADQTVYRIAARTGVKLAGLDPARDEELFVRCMEEQAAVGADASTKLEAILKALGVEDPGTAIAKITDLIQQADSLVKAMPELEALRQAQAAAEEKDQEAEVEEAMASYAIPEAARVALSELRKANAKLFAEKYPRRDPKVAALTRPIATERPATMPTQGGDVGPRLSALGNVRLGSSGQMSRPQLGPGITSQVHASAGGAIDVSGMSGRNTTEKAMTYLRLNAGFDWKTEGDAKWGEAHKAASLGIRRGEFVCAGQ